MASFSGELEARLQAALKQRNRWREAATKRQAQLDHARDEIETVNVVSIALIENIAVFDSAFMAVQGRVDAARTAIKDGQFDASHVSTLLDSIENALKGLEL